MSLSSWPKVARCLLTYGASAPRCYATGQAATETHVASDCLLQHLTGPHNGIAVISLNRAVSKNAIGMKFIKDLQRHVAALKNEHKDSTRAIILKSNADKVFCAGADLKERHEMKQEDVSPFVKSLRDTFTALERIPIPIIAALDGAAFGGGLELALAADLRIAQENVLVGLPEANLAIIPGAGGTQRLPRLVGPARAKEMIFLGKIMAAKECSDLFNHLVPSKDPAAGSLQARSYSTSCGSTVISSGPAFEKSLEWALEILKKGPVAVRMAKIAIMAGMDVNSMNDALTVEEMCYAQVIPTIDRIEGLNSFREKRPPIYFGK